MDQPRFVDLSDRSCGNWFGKLGKNSLNALAQLGCDHRLGQIGRKGWQLILQVFQLQRHLFAHNIGAGRQDLAELDVRRPKCC